MKGDLIPANPVPSNITANRQAAQLEVAWKDGHTSQIPFALLRSACPCVTCRGGHDKMGTEPYPAVFRASLPESAATRIRKIELVGTYAINIEWEDGHHYGIYNWLYLRRLCPCAECQGLTTQEIDTHGD